MGKMDEMILVVPRDILFENEKLTFQGTETDPMKITKIGMNIERNFSSIRRGDAEEDFTLKQPIPYAVIRKGDKIFGYKRLEGGGETRLHGKISLGVGGHLNDVPDFETFVEILIENLKREIEEELVIRPLLEADLQVIGFVNDDSDDVGRVHLGILVVMDVDAESEITVRETEQLEGMWFSMNELMSKDIYDSLENWSKIAVNSLFGV